MTPPAHVDPVINYSCLINPTEDFLINATSAAGTVEEQEDSLEGLAVPTSSQFTSWVDVDDEVLGQFARRDDPEFRELVSRRPELFTAEIVDRAAAERNLFGVSARAIRCRLCLTGRLTDCL